MTALVHSREPVAGESDLVAGLQPMARRIAVSYSLRYATFSADELEAAALEGVLLAVRAYDDARGTSLRAYAWRRARTAILDHVRQFTPGTRALEVRKLSLAELLSWLARSAGRGGCGRGGGEDA